MSVAAAIGITLGSIASMLWKARNKSIVTCFVDREFDFSVGMIISAWVMVVAYKVWP